MVFSVSTPLELLRFLCFFVLFGAEKEDHGGAACARKKAWDK
jgi:hypothetical protein